MNIYLLTHERELDRPTNTGAIALSVAGGVNGLIQRILWSRTNPNQVLLRLLVQGRTGLLYPFSEADGTAIALDECENFILLDAT